MDHDPGDDFDCDACGGTHIVRSGKELDVSVAGGGLEPALYVRCPEAGFVSLSDPDVVGGDDAGGDDWP